MKEVKGFDNFVLRCVGGNVSSNIDYYKREIQTKNEQVEKYVKVLKKEVKKLEKVKKKSKKIEEEIFTKLKDLDFVKSLTIKNNTLYIRTKNLIVNYKTKKGDKTRNFGPYNILFSSGGSVTVLKIPKRRGDQHMYVSYNGNVCFGTSEIIRQVQKWIKEVRFDLVSVMIWDLLSNYSSDSTPYIDISSFMRSLKKKKRR